MYGAKITYVGRLCARLSYHMIHCSTCITNRFLLLYMFNSLFWCCYRGPLVSKFCTKEFVFLNYYYYYFYIDFLYIYIYIIFIIIITCIIIINIIVWNCLTSSLLHCKLSLRFSLEKRKRLILLSSVNHFIIIYF